MEKLSFKSLSTLVEKQFIKLANDSSYTLVRARVDNDTLWNLYLDSFPEGTNEIFRERSEHDCNCCKNFIRRVGSVLAIKDNKVTSIWDVDAPGYFKPVVDTLSAHVKSLPIDNLYLTSENIAGNLSNKDTINPEIIWDHFYVKIPAAYVLSNDSIGPKLSNSNADFGVLKRSLVELTLESAEIVKELIDQNSLYNGKSQLQVIELFINLKKEFDNIQDEYQKDLFVWQKSKELKAAGRIKNTVIGTLLADLSDNVDLEKAVASFESKVAGPNYKRSSSIVSASQVKKAQEKIEELGYTDSLHRRLATVSDISVNNVLFTSVHEKTMDVFGDVAAEANRRPKSFDKVEEISIENFIKDVLPNVKTVEAFFESKHKSNLMTLVAPIHASSKNMFKWDNQISWAYNGDVTDSIKERVKAAGGKVEGDLRISLSWFNGDDLDLSCIEPNGNNIYFGAKVSRTSGELDIDMNAYGKHSDTEPVENIIYSNKGKMPTGDYKVKVHNYNKRRNENFGFSLQVEYNNEIQTLSTSNPVKQNELIKALTIHYDGEKFSIKDVWDGFTSTSLSKENVWNITSGEFIPVTMIMNSPNHWDGNNVGNKHVFFLLEGCNTDQKTRGFYNEFLINELNTERKVLEIVGNKLKIEPADTSLSGIGFNETVKNELIVRVTGKMKRLLKVIF